MHIQSARIGKELSLRFNLIFEIIGSLIFFFLHLISFYLILGKFSFPGWSGAQIWIMLFTFEIYTYLAFFVFWKGLTRTVEDIRRGTLDPILVKPANARFIAFLRSGGLHNLVACILGIIFLVIGVVRFDLSVNPAGIFLYLVFLATSLWIIHCLSVIIVSLNFRFGYLPSTPGAVFEVQEVYKYPSTIYLGRSLLAGMFVIPLSLLTTLPATVFLLKPVSLPLISVYLGFVVFVTILSHLAWNRGLRQYSSAGS